MTERIPSWLAVIDEVARKKHWFRENPIEKKIKLAKKEPRRTIVELWVRSSRMPPCRQWWAKLARFTYRLRKVPVLEFRA
jgi:hypothetical protein